MKVVALVALGVLGALYRRRLIGRLGEDAGRPAASGPSSCSSSGYGRGIRCGGRPLTHAPLRRRAQRLPSRSPGGAPHRRPASSRAHADRWLTSWNIDLLWAFVAGFGVFFYLAGVWRLRRRGDAWPVYRTVLWVAGLALLVWVTGGVVNVYQDYLFSIHMVGHMLLTMAIPLLLVAGAPVTLAARAIRKRDDDTRGGREWILWAVHSPVARVLTNPFVAAGLFIGLAVGLLLHRPLPLVALRPPRARVDDRPLPHHGIPLRAEPHRHRPGAVPAAVSRPACAAHRRSWRCTRSSASPS